MSAKKGKAKSKKEISVQVVVRCRPLNSTEKANGNERCVDMDVAAGKVTVNNLKGSPEDSKSFTFDAIYDWNSKQQDIYDETARPIVEAVLGGMNGTIFAYGQTGTGKTFTMEGMKDPPELKGVIPQSFEHIFKTISQCKPGQRYLVRASYLEIYQEKIRDLLSKSKDQKLELKDKPDSGVYVKDLSSFVVKSTKEIEHVMYVGNKNRKTSATNMNAHSSRSHAIFIITIECGEIGADGESHIRVGKLNLVDLAGSEKVAKTGAQGTQMKEGIAINVSLSALGNVICALVEGGRSSHIPYRDSKLTRLLQDSLGGNARTVMIANMGPADYNFDESIGTLRYADRAKKIKNKPKINEDPKDALLREFQDQIAKLKSQLDGKGKPKKKKKKKKKRVNPDTGEEEYVDDDEDEDDGENTAAQEALRKEAYEQEKAKLEQERQQLAANQEATEAQKAEIAAELAKRTEELDREKKEQEELAKKIAAMEAKVLGQDNVIDRTTAQERELEKKNAELVAARLEERRVQRELQEKKEAVLEAETSFNDKQHELDSKSKKLKKAYQKLQSAKAEIEDLQDEFAKSREELLHTTTELQRELKLREMIIEHFIPPDEVEKVRKRVDFDTEYDQWRLQPMGFDAGDEKSLHELLTRPTSAISGSRHAITQDARMRASIDRNPRYRPENIYLVDLDMPQRTTHDYLGPAVDLRVQMALDQALEAEGDLEIEADPEANIKNGIANYKKREKRARSRSRSARDQAPVAPAIDSTPRPPRPPTASDTPESRPSMGITRPRF